MAGLTSTPGSSATPPTTEQPGQTQPRRDSASTTLTNYLIVSGLLTCASIGTVQLGLQVSSTWNAGYVPVLCLFIALESAYMTRFVRYGKLPAPWYVLRGVEAMVLFLMLRALLGILRGPQLLPDITPNHVDVELLVMTLLALLIWLSSWRIVSDLLDLETLDPALDREVVHEIAAEQVESRRSLISFIVILGVVLTFLAGLLRVHWRSTQPSDPPGLYGIWHLIIYFFLALVLFSRTRLNLLRSGWIWERVPLGQRVGARWITYTVLLLTAAVIIAVLLPTRYSLGLLGTLSYLLNFVIALVQTIVYAIMALILNILSRLFPDLPPAPPPPSQDIWPRLPANISPPTSADFIQSLIFWGAFFIIAGYVVVQFLQQHPDLLEGLKHLPGISLVIRFWQRLRAWFGGLNQQIEDLLEARRRARRPSATRSVSAPQRWINLRRLSPRQQVRFYYLAMLRRGGERGHARQPTQTPYEYARTLESQLPEIDRDVDGLTEEFIEARYSQHDIPVEHVGLVRRYWERIKRALRR
ncbi:MAG TPA: DUF4129 domain-containing protein [Anaerolineae bacterium]|nr:DUF4129 domain-containing protein [Anaerolineae bacterium]